jgi:threonine dehydratase
MRNQLGLDRIEEAARFLCGRIRRTPMEASPGLSAKLGVPVWLKLESLQLTGSIKIRGALFRMSRLSEAERRSGIVTCSAGNHGKACAYAGRELSVRTTIYVPSTVDQAKYQGMISLGAEVVVAAPTGYDETEDLAQEEARRSGRPFLSGFDDFDVMAANGGTLAMEILDDLPQAGNFIFPVGGGGLGAGLAFYAKEKIPGARLIGCQLEASPAFQISLARGRAATRMPSVETIAGGIEGGIGAQTFEILRTRMDHVALVNDSDIRAAMRWMLDEHQYLIEPTAAAAVAACLSGKVGSLDGPTVVVITGRNVSGATIRKIVCP